MRQCESPSNSCIKAEISALSEELESAEDFPLLVETDFGRTVLKHGIHP